LFQFLALFTIDHTFEDQRDQCGNEFIEQLTETFLFFFLLAQTAPSRPERTVFQIFWIDEDLKNSLRDTKNSFQDGSTMPHRETVAGLAY
jgi:hypothetical protein